MLTVDWRVFLADLQDWRVPELPPQYFIAPWHWWNQQGHSGHGLFDLLTPRLADVAIQASVSGPLCQMAVKVLDSAAANLARSVGREEFHGCNSRDAGQPSDTPLMYNCGGWVEGVFEQCEST